MPDSVLVLLIAVAMLLFSTFCSAVLVDAGEEQRILLSLATSVLAYVLYAIALYFTGFIRRTTPTISSIMACGSIISVLAVAAYVLLRPFIGIPFAGLVSTLILFWSVPVKGHIIARAIERHWYVGIAIAASIFVLQIAIYSATTGEV